jgi:hypothetical protein
MHSLTMVTIIGERATLSGALPAQLDGDVTAAIACRPGLPGDEPAGIKRSGLARE